MIAHLFLQCGRERREIAVLGLDVLREFAALRVGGFRAALTWAPQQERWLPQPSLAVQKTERPWRDPNRIGEIQEATANVRVSEGTQDFNEWRTSHLHDEVSQGRGQAALGQR